MTDYQRITTAESVRLPPSQHPGWDTEGVVHLRGLLPHALIDAYVAERTRLLGGTPLWEPGWPDPTPYLRVPSMLTLGLHPRLIQAIAPLIGGEEPGLHLCLTGFRSTERAWHQDRYLNPESVGERYIAAWLVLDDVHPDAGPFEYLPGSHRWPVIERGKVWEEMRRRGQRTDVPTWPSDSQGWVGATCHEEARRRGATPRAFLGKKGDVLLWHASLIHRGSPPRDASRERRALICHYSSIHARPDFPAPSRHPSGGAYFDFEALPPRPPPGPAPEPSRQPLGARLRRLWRDVLDETR